MRSNYRFAFLAILAVSNASSETLFTDVRLVDGTGSALSEPMNVLVRDSVIAAIGAGVKAPDAELIEGRGRTLMPGLIDVHVHTTFSALPLDRLVAPDLTPAEAEAAAADGAKAPLADTVTSRC